MLNRTEFRSEKTTRKKGVVSLKKSPSSENDDAYSEARELMRRRKRSDLSPHSASREISSVAPLKKIPSSVNKRSKEKCSKEGKTLYKEAVENISGTRVKSGSSKYEKSFSNQNQFQGRSKPNKNVYAKNLKSFLAPGEINHAKRGMRYSGDCPVYTERDFASVVKNFPDSSKNCRNLEHLYSAESLKAFSNALSMLTNQHSELNEKSLNSLAQKNKSKSDDVNKDDSRSKQQIHPKYLKVTESERYTDRYKHVARKRSGIEVTRSKKFGEKLDTQSLSSSNSDDYLKDLKLNELNELNEDELREIYEISTTDLTRTSKRNFSINPNHVGKENVENERPCFKEHSKICLKSQSHSKVPWKNSEMSSKDCGEHNLLCNRLESKNSENKRYKKPQNDAELGSESGTGTSKHFGRKSFEIRTTKSRNLCQRNSEAGVMKNFKHSARSRTETMQLSSQNLYRQRLETEMTDCGQFDCERPEPEMGRPKHLDRKSLARSRTETMQLSSQNLYCQRLETEMTDCERLDRERPKPETGRPKHFDQKRLEREMVRRSHRKPPAKELTSGFNLGSKSSIHLCQMIAKTLPDAKTVPFDKLSEILPETELAKINEKLDKNMEEKQFLPGLLEDTQLHIDRIKQQVLRKAKECLPNATFSKINQFLLSNKSENCLELPSKKPEVACSTPSLVPKPKQNISYQELKSVSSGCRKRSGRSSAASYHGGDATRWRKYGRKTLTKSNSYYDHLYSVYSDSKQRCEKSRRKYASENRLSSKTNQPKSLKTMKRNITKENHYSRYNWKPNRSVSTEDILKVCHHCNEYVVNCICTFDSCNFNRSIVCCTSGNRLSNSFVDYDHKPGCNEAEQDIVEIYQTSNRFSCDCNHIDNSSFIGNHSFNECGLDHENFNFCFETLSFEDPKKMDCEDTNKCPLNMCQNSHYVTVTSDCNILSSTRDRSFEKSSHYLMSADKKRENLDLDPSYNCNQNFASNQNLNNCDCKYKTLPEGGDHSFNESCSNCRVELKTKKKFDIKYNHSCSYDISFHQKLITGSKICDYNNLHQAGDSFGITSCDHNFDLLLKNENSNEAKYFSSCTLSFQDRCNNFDPSEHNDESPNQTHESKKLDLLDKSSDFHKSKHQSSHCKPNFSNLITLIQEKGDSFNREYEPTNFNEYLKKGCVDSNLGKYSPGDSPYKNWQVEHNISSWHTNSYESDSGYPVELQRSCLPKNSDQNQFNQLQEQSELWHGLYEPTEKEPDALNAHYYLRLANKLLNRELFGSVATNKAKEKPNRETLIESTSFIDVGKTTASNETAFQKLKPNLDDILHRFKRKNKYFVSFCAYRMLRNSKSRELFSNRAISETDHGNGTYKTRSSEIRSLSNNASLRNGSRLRERVCKYGISKSRGEQICVYQNLMKSAALEFLRFTGNFNKESITLDKVTVSEMKSRPQEQSKTSVSEQKSHLESFTYPNILVRVPEVTSLCATPRFLNPTKSQEKITNSLQKVLFTEAKDKSTLEISCEAVANSSTQSPQKYFVKETNAGFLCVKEDLHSKCTASRQLRNSQKLGSNFRASPNYLYFCSSKKHELSSNFTSLITLFLQPPHSQNDGTFLKIQIVSHPFNLRNSELKLILKFHSAPNFLEVLNPYELQVISVHQSKVNVLKIWNSNQLFKPLSTSHSSTKYVLNPPVKTINSQFNEIVSCSQIEINSLEGQRTSEYKPNLKKLKKNGVTEVSRNKNRPECTLETNFHVEMDNFQKDELGFCSLDAKIKLESQYSLDHEPIEKIYFKRIDCQKNELALPSHSATSFFKVSTSHGITNQFKSHSSSKLTLISGLISPSSYEARSRQVLALHEHFASKLPNTSRTRKNNSITTDECTLLDMILASVNSFDDPVLCSLKPKSHDLLETEVSFFYLLCLLTKWRFEYYSQKQVKNKTFPKNCGRNNKKNTELVNRVTQTDLSLTNPELFDAFLLTRILSPDDT